MTHKPEGGIRQEVWGKLMFHSSILEDREALDAMIETCKMTARRHAPEGRDVVFSPPKIWMPPKKGTLASIEVTGLVLAESVTMPT